MPGRRWLTWLIYALCALLVVDVLGWATWRVLRLEQAEQVASAKADAAQHERLALWQMDSLVSTLIARESARPYFEFRPRYAADLPYDGAWRLDEAGVVARSPLAAGTGDPIIRLHFQIEPDGRVVSPQIDPDEVTPGTDDLRARRILRELTNNQSFLLETGGTPADVPVISRHPAETTLGESEEALSDAASLMVPTDEGDNGSGGDSARGDLSDADLRQQLFDIARSARNTSEPVEPHTDVVVGPFQPRWLFDASHETQLVFERTVSVGGDVYRQGIWIDWPALRADLLAVAVRLLPDARLDPVARPTGPSTRTLATIPLRLEAPPVPRVLPLWTPIRLTLVVTWIAAVTALAAIGLVLRAAMNLARRRGKFVTAVTHELRSPLTSFRLLTDLLARTDDEDKRLEHIESLRRESRRLASVVENVLAYAGLRQRREGATTSPLGERLERLIPSLEQRARQSGVTLDLHIDDDINPALVSVSPGSVERILSNLIDNACRYGSDGPDARIRLSATRTGTTARLRVSDTGPGVPSADRERIFSDFYRGRSSQRTHSGMGLGLALARGLARAERGDLRLVRQEGPGAVFELTLPITTESER